MADGGVPQLSVSGSDDFYSFTCTLCFRKDRTTLADVYCIQCEEYLCKICLDNHNSFAKMAVHILQDRDQMEAKSPQRVQPLLTVPCEQHPRQVYSLYCSKHDKVGCPVCTPIHHKLCDVDYIPDILNDDTLGTELREFKRTASEIYTNLEKLKEERRKDIESLAVEKDREVDKIHHTIEAMMKDLQALEKSAIDDTTRMYHVFKSNIDRDLNKIDSMLKVIDHTLDKVEKASNEAAQFVLIKNALDVETYGKELVQEIQAHVGKEGLIYVIDKLAEDAMKKLQSLGQLVVDYEFSVTLAGKRRVDTKQDGSICVISDICLSEDGTILIVDFNNVCLKRYSSSFKPIGRLQLDNTPYGVCISSTGQAAVTLRNSKAVQIVTLGISMTLGKTFKTSGRCHGILRHNDQLFIACGGWSQEGEDPGHIAVYSIPGTLVRKIETNSKGGLFSSIPSGIAVRSMYDDVILVCDRDNGLVAIGQDGQRVWTVSCEHLGVDNVNRVSVNSHGVALVSSYRSNKVVLVNRNGRKLGELLTARDGINKPVGVCYDSQRSRLIVGMKDNDRINVYRST